MKRVMRGIIVMAVVLLFLLSTAVGPSSIQAQTKRLVTIASGWVVGVYYPLAGAMSRIIHTKLPELRATVESSGASVANAKLIGSGDADFAILQNDIAYYAYNGQLMFDKPIKNMGGVFTLYPELIQIAARKEAKIASIRDLKGKRVSIGPLGSGTEANTIQILEAYGMGLQDLGRVERLGAAEATEQLKDGRIDAAFYTVGLGAAALIDAFLAGEMALVPVVGKEAEALKKKYPFYTSVNVPAGTYRGLDKDVTTVSVMAMMIARSDLPEDLVYKFTKTIFDNLDTFYGAHANAKYLTLKTATEGMSVPLHPGAAKFYKEKGVI